MDKLKCHECGAETKIGCDKIKALSCSCGGMKVKPAELEWISVEDRLPEIPKGNYAVQVLAVQYDPVYAEITKGHGYSVSEITFDVEGFKILFCGGKDGSGFMPPTDEVKFWMYLPNPPKAD